MGKTRENENNVNWVGNKIKYKSLHYYLKNKKIKPKFCERCGQKPPYDIALKEGKKYTRNIDDYEWLCRRCHMVDDGRLEKVKQRCLEKKIEVNIELIKHKRFVEKKSQQKIADEMDIDRSIVRNRLKKLKDYECDVVKWSS